MPQTLLSTKLSVPPPRQKLVTRAGPLAMLSQARNYRLTLVSAPPGYGKTTLVSSWLGGENAPFAWFSLDEGDNDPTRFLEYFLAVLHPVVPAIRPEMLDLLQGSQAVSFESFMSILINTAAGASDFFLVLDDFHVLHSQPVLDMIAFLLEHLPPVMHLVLLSRTDPALPLSRLRARGQLLDLRVEQLRFTKNEIAQFYDEVMGLKLSVPDIAAIEARTEGWIAGLQLAGLAMQSAWVAGEGSHLAENDPHSFVMAFAGSHAYIMDYLTEEVLRSQPAMMRTFLLHTAILDRMCAPLCEAVVGTEANERIDGQAILESIEQKHLFVIPLDGERRWYRYHHLFKEVLCRRLEALHSEQIPDLHNRASQWFERHGLIHEAIQHAMQASNQDLTARLVEQYGCDLLMGGELATLGNWLAVIDPYTHTRPWLAMQKAWVLSLSGQPERAIVAIDAGEQLLSTLELTDEVRTLRGSFAAARAHWANTQGKTYLAVQYARHAIDLLGVSGDFSCALRSVATSLLGDASWVQGNMDDARRAYAEAAQIGQIAGNAHMTMMSYTSLADVHFEMGQVHQAARIYTDTLRMAEQVDGPNSAYAYQVHFGLGRVYYAWNRLDDAATSLEQCLRLCQLWGNTNLPAACLTITAQIQRSKGSVGKALEAAAAAQEWIRSHTLSPEASIQVKAGLARFWLGLGLVEKAFVLVHDTGILPETFALDAVSQMDISPELCIPYSQEPLYRILARLLLALDRPDAVLILCERLLLEAKQGGRWEAVLEVLILQALAYHARKEPHAALTAMERAIGLAWPEQAARAFLDEGERMARLLYQAKAHHIGGEFVEGMLAWFDQFVEKETHPAQPVQNLLVEPLSSRELEVLSCIAEGCSNQEIADRFILSPKTVKRHVSNIYGKLGAKSRTQAVSLARSLKLID